MTLIRTDNTDTREKMDCGEEQDVLREARQWRGYE
jgi:hypothetical protein